MGPKKKEDNPLSERLQLKLLLSQGDLEDESTVIGKQSAKLGTKKEINNHKKKNVDELPTAKNIKQKTKKDSIKPEVEEELKPIVKDIKNKNKKGLIQAEVEDKAKLFLIDSQVEKEKGKRNVTKKANSDIKIVESAVANKRGRKNSQVKEEDNIVKLKDVLPISDPIIVKDLNKNQDININDNETDGIKRKSSLNNSKSKKNIIDTEDDETDNVAETIDVIKEDEITKEVDNDTNNTTEIINITQVSENTKESLDIPITSSKKRTHSSIDKTEEYNSTTNRNMSEQNILNKLEITKNTESTKYNNRNSQKLEYIDSVLVTNHSDSLKKVKTSSSNHIDDKRKIDSVGGITSIVTQMPINITKSYNTVTKKTPKDRQWVNDFEKIVDDSEILTYAKNYPHEYLFHGRHDEEDPQATSWGSFLSYKDDKLKQFISSAKDVNTDVIGKQRPVRNQKNINISTIKIKEFDHMQLFSVDNNINDPSLESDRQRFLETSLAMQDANVKTEYKTYQSSDADNIFAGCPISVDQSLKFWGIRQCPFLMIEIKKKEDDNIRQAIIQREKREKEEKIRAKQLEEEALQKKIELEKKRKDQERRLEMSRKFKENIIKKAEEEEKKRKDNEKELLEASLIIKEKEITTKKSADMIIAKDSQINNSHYQSRVANDRDSSVNYHKIQKSSSIHRNNEDYDNNNNSYKRDGDKSIRHKKDEQDRREKSKSPIRNRDNEKIKFNDKPNYEKYRSRSRSRSNKRGKDINDNRDSNGRYSNTNNDYDSRKGPSNEYHNRDQYKQYNRDSNLNSSSRDNRDYNLNSSSRDYRDSKSNYKNIYDSDRKGQSRGDRDRYDSKYSDSKNNYNDRNYHDSKRKDLSVSHSSKKYSEDNHRR